MLSTKAYRARSVRRAVERRRLIIIAAAAVIAAAIVFLLVIKPHFLSEKGKAKRHVKHKSTVPAAGKTRAAKPSAPPKPRLTGIVDTDIVNYAAYLVSRGVRRVRYTVWSFGGPHDLMRGYAIAEAAYKLNMLLAEKKIPLRIQVDTVFMRTDGNKFLSTLIKAYREGRGPDIVAVTPQQLAVLADNGYIMDLTRRLKAYEARELRDYYKSLLEAGRIRGKAYGIPCEADTWLLYWSATATKCLSARMGESVQAKLKLGVERAEITWSSIYDYMRLAVADNCASWGLLYSEGGEYEHIALFVYAFGGRLFDPSKGKLVFEPSAIREWLRFEWRLARENLMPSDIMKWYTDSQLYPAVLSDETMLWIGSVRDWIIWQKKPYYWDARRGLERPLTSTELKQKFYYTLFPAGSRDKKPLVLANPILWAISNTAGRQNPSYKELRDIYETIALILLLKANDPEISALHSIISFKLPPREKTARLLGSRKWPTRATALHAGLSNELKERMNRILAENKHDAWFLAEISPMLKHAKTPPPHPLYKKYMKILAISLANVLQNKLKPEEAVNYAEQLIRKDSQLYKNTIVLR
ncbi:MAG: hypothetical protein DSY37_01060 [Hyperthermus sp.]|nr:MAG: hypothetical protein DSY37_01060 [Hyperthermus sp.]